MVIPHVYPMLTPCLTHAYPMLTPLELCAPTFEFVPLMSPSVKKYRFMCCVWKKERKLWKEIKFLFEIKKWTNKSWNRHYHLWRDLFLRFNHGLAVDDVHSPNASSFVDSLVKTKYDLAVNCRTNLRKPSCTTLVKSFEYVCLKPGRALLDLAHSTQTA